MKNVNVKTAKNVDAKKIVAKNIKAITKATDAKIAKAAKAEKVSILNGLTFKQVEALVKKGAISRKKDKAIVTGVEDFKVSKNGTDRVYKLSYDKGVAGKTRNTLLDTYFVKA